MHARFLAVDNRTMRSLAGLASGFAAREMCIHLVVVHKGKSVVEWYDLPSDPIAIASTVEEVQVRAFAEATGGRYEKCQPGV